MWRFTYPYVEVYLPICGGLPTHMWRFTYLKNRNKNIFINEDVNDTLYMDAFRPKDRVLHVF
jgi:hypothetical protein